MWMIVGRAVLKLISGNRPNFLTGLFSKVTDPVYRTTKAILPFVKEGWIPFVSFVLIVILRLLLIIVSSPTGVPK